MASDMVHHVLEMPIDERQVRALGVGDTVTLERTLFGIRDATQIHMFDRGRRTRFDLNGHAVIHTAPNVRRVERSNEHPAGYAPVCIVIGKGGLGDASRAAFRELGGAYLAIVGGAAALETTWITAIEDVDLEDLDPESLWRFAVRGFGPILVAMDAHGGSLYDKVREMAESRRAAALAAMGVGQ